MIGDDEYNDMEKRMQANVAAQNRKSGSAVIAHARRKLGALGVYDDGDVLGDRVNPRALMEAAGPDGQLTALLEGRKISSPGELLAAQRMAANKNGSGSFITEDGYSPQVRASQADIETMAATRRALDASMDGAAQRLASDYLGQRNSAATRILEAEVTRSDAARVVAYGDWRVEPHIKTTKGGKDLIRYIAAGPGGRTYPYEFRHKSAATMTAAALNETGGLLEDRRIKRLVELSEEESQQIAEYNRHKKLLEAVEPGNQKRRGNHLNLMENAQSRVRQIRSLLGA